MCSQRIPAGSRFQRRDGSGGVVEVLSVGKHRASGGSGYEGVYVEHVEGAQGARKGTGAWWAMHLFKDAFEPVEGNPPMRGQRSAA